MIYHLTSSGLGKKSVSEVAGLYLGYAQQIFCHLINKNRYSFRVRLGCVKNSLRARQRGENTGVRFSKESASVCPLFQLHRLNVCTCLQDRKGDEFILVPAENSQYTTFGHVLADVEANNRELLGGPDTQSVSRARNRSINCLACLYILKYQVAR